MNIQTPEPKWNSNLTEAIIKLEQIKNRNLSGTTHPQIFIQLKQLFHIVEALASARIEGNHTTLAAYIENKDDNQLNKTESMSEIGNIFDALNFIDENIQKEPINSNFIKELHKHVVSDLKTGKGGEGDARVGAYRSHDVRISQSSHIPPSHYDVDDRMKELCDYINEPCKASESLLKIAIAHHRFVWIHPFGNGNGRTARLLTYAMLCKEGYITPNGFRLFNPASVFANNRNEYYKKLSQADDLENEHILEWCDYFLTGLKEEIDKTTKLTDSQFVKNQLLLPSIERMSRNGILSKLENDILWRAINNDGIKAGEISDLWDANITHSAISNQIKKMRDKKYLIASIQNSREYILNISENKIISRYVLEQMEKNNMLPLAVDDSH